MFTAEAQTCPNCGAPLQLDRGHCAFCRVPIVLHPDAAATAGPPAAAPAQPAGDPAAPFFMVVQDIFAIKGRGTIVTGQIAAGTVRVGDRLAIVGARGNRTTTCDAIEMFRKKLDTAAAGDNVGLLLQGVDKSDVATGDQLRAPTG